MQCTFQATPCQHNSVMYLLSAVSAQCTVKATSYQHTGVSVRCMPSAGFPFIVLNTVCGSLAAYGFAGLRYTPSAIILFQVMLVLQSLAAVQLLILCVDATPTQACASFFHMQ